MLSVKNLWVKFPTNKGLFDAVRGISFSLGRERLGIVGESGSGKSMTGRAILRLIRPPGFIMAEYVKFGEDNLIDLDESKMRSIRGRRISMVMQDPKFSLNPVMTIGAQIIEAYRQHNDVPKRVAYQKAIEMLDAVLIRDTERVLRAYPHEVSGGMGQRIMIAMMLIPNPDILIADEPTSALDVSVQKQVMSILDGLVTRRGMGLILISHDLNLVSQFCDRVLIMYAGRIVEVCDAGALHQARHPYTQGLLNSLPRLTEKTRHLSVLQRDPAWAQPDSVTS
ncbi:MAG: ABC transporter ATP-binding protein [Aestuariivita sp.]|nr:ABC transporter ATP-binding protein [Aestuariivita sp.]